MSHERRLCTWGNVCARGGTPTLVSIGTSRPGTRLLIVWSCVGGGTEGRTSESGYANVHEDAKMLQSLFDHVVY